MYPAPFDYSAPDTLLEALTLLDHHGDDAKLLAGGQSLLPLLKLRFMRPAHLIDLRRIPSLSGITKSKDSFVIGAMTTHAAIADSSELRAALPILGDAAGHIGDPQVRNRGTIGGSVAHADPAADWPAVMLATGARMCAVGPMGEREIDAEDFFVDVMTSSLFANEVLTEIRIPLPAARVGGAYAKCSHPASRYALVGVAATVKLGSDGRTVSEARIAVTGIGARARRFKNAEGALTGKALNAETIGAAATLTANATDPVSDSQGDAAYRRNLVRVYTERALTSAAARGV